LSEFDDYSYLLSQEINLAIETQDQNLIERIRSYWNNESWKSIQSKFNTEGSTWYVWWSDGVNKFAEDSQWDRQSNLTRDEQDNAERAYKNDTLSLSTLLVL
jgi:hypothetical protein